MLQEDLLDYKTVCILYINPCMFQILVLGIASLFLESSLSSLETALLRMIYPHSHVIVLIFCTGFDVFVAAAFLDQSFTDHSFIFNVPKKNFLHTCIRTPATLKWYLKVVCHCDSMPLMLSWITCSHGPYVDYLLVPVHPPIRRR